jgi:energy-coupling factor transporter ATP-binding protein EcfA2
MSALDSIIKWAEEDLLDWQSDALRRLLVQEAIGDEDKAEILLMIKEKHGIIDPEHPAPKPQALKKGDISGAPQTIVKITLKALKDLYNVNAIPDGSCLPFAHKGLTVIYGENGSGKSGYARVLKKACSARDTKEKLLPNVFKKGTQDPAHACIKYSINDGVDKEMLWQDGQREESNILSNICVFDSKCARIIVDENNEATYLPYGTTVFEEMVALFKELRQKLEIEKPKLEKLNYPEIPASTKAGIFISELNHKTKDEDIERAAVWTIENQDKLAALRKYIAGVEIETVQKQSQRLRNLRDRVQSLSGNIKEMSSALSEDKVEVIRGRMSNLQAAESALAIASQQSLSKEPLPGVGEKVWRSLYTAAKEYSIQLAYPGKEFPVTEEGSLCVLCMQSLSPDAKTRMLRFMEFMEKTAKRDLDEAQEEIKAAIKEVEDIKFPSYSTYKDIMDEFRERDPIVIAQTEKYIPAMEARAAEILIAIKANITIEPKAVVISPEQGLAVLASQLEKEAGDLEKALRPEEHKLKKLEKEELEARKSLSERNQEIANYVNQLRLIKKYENCISETDFLGITLKGKQIITEALTPQLKSALEEELSNLDATYLPLNIKASGIEGETKHKLELKGSQAPPKSNLSDILSEGEHCVVALAGFLAELKVANHECPIIFDDPVCSLDHMFRENIAKRLVEESKVRQVIIFTHDIAFLIGLQSKSAETEGVFVTPQTVRKVSDSIGKCFDGLPWHAMKVRERLGDLRKELEAIGGLYADNQLEYNRKAAELYALLRETWEAFVEEILLYDTIKRHGNEVQTQRLKSVTVKTEDYKTIHLGMAKCSEWMRGHDKSKALSENRPMPKEIQEDIEKLGQYTKEINNRHQTLRDEREKALAPKTASIG